mmetsp:Transcript_88267/g.189482  ORF Transcript_88267/g.189482 Transcript_88267/m.189482 type:complete len:599 (+) Transcript_88267:82-1878(+)
MVTCAVARSLLLLVGLLQAPPSIADVELAPNGACTEEASFWGAAVAKSLVQVQARQFKMQREKLGEIQQARARSVEYVEKATFARAGWDRAPEEAGAMSKELLLGGERWNLKDIMPSPWCGPLVLSLLCSIPPILFGYLCFVRGKPWYFDGIQGTLSPTEHALCFCFFNVFANHIVFSSIIPDLQAWAKSVSVSQRFSGFVFGAWMAATLFGYLLLWHKNRKQEDWSVVTMRPLLMWSSFLSAMGSVLFMVCAGRRPSASVIHISLFTCGRILAGIGAGISLAATRVFAMRVTPVADQPMCNARYTFYLTSGVGFGPIAGSAVKGVVSSVYGYSSSVYAMGGLHIALCLILMIGSVCFPRTTDVVVMASPRRPREVVSGEGEVASAHRMVICSCIFITFSRAMAVGGLEVATANILENKYGWSNVHIGWMIGASYLVCIPQRLCHESYKHLLSTTIWIRSGLVLSCVGSALFFETLAKRLFPYDSGRVGLLILADVLLFPSMQLVSGLIEGTANKHSLPHGNTFALTNVVLYSKFATNFMGFLIGPMCADWQLQRGGQNWYAFQQLVLTALCGVVFEAGVVPYARQAALQSFQLDGGK